MVVHTLRLLVRIECHLLYPKGRPVSSTKNHCRSCKNNLKAVVILELKQFCIIGWIRRSLWISCTQQVTGVVDAMQLQDWFVSGLLKHSCSCSQYTCLHSMEQRPRMNHISPGHPSQWCEHKHNLWALFGAVVPRDGKHNSNKYQDSLSFRTTVGFSRRL